MLVRVYDGQSADLLAIGADACRWFTRLISISYQSSIFRYDAQVEGYNWVVYPMRGCRCGETSSFAEPCGYLRVLV
jgi:hypothetical protein